MSKLPFIQKISDHLQHLKNLSKTEQGKEILTFLGFVVLATGIWFILAINDTRESIVRIPLELTNVPEEATLIQDMPPYIEARIRDKGAALLSYNINGIAPIKIEFDRHSNQRDAITISNNTLVEYSRKQLRATTTINDFAPDSIRIAYTTDLGKRLPIAIKADISTSPFSTLSDSIYATPDSVTIYGKAAQISRIKEIYTEEIVAHDITDTTYIRAHIQPIEGTRIIPDSVTIVIPVEEYITKTISVPVVIGGVPSGYSIMTFPSHISLTCLVPKSKYAQIVSEEFLIGNTYEELEKTPGTYGAITVLNAPNYTHNIILKTDSVEYIVSENTRQNNNYVQQPDTTQQP